MKHGHRFVDLTGRIFNDTVEVLRFHEKRKRGRSVWWCKCLRCGNEFAAWACNLTKPGHTRSCGCYNMEKVIERSTTHGETRNGKHTPEFWSVHGAIDRCSNPNYHHYHRYGGRGIKVCEGIKSVSGLIAIIGRKTADRRSLGRIDNDGHYSCGVCAECAQNSWPKNVRWETMLEQNNNKNFTVRINGKSVAQVALETGKTIRQVRQEHGLRIRDY